MGGFFSPATLEQIRAASDIVDVIGGYVPAETRRRQLRRPLPVSQGKDRPASTSIRTSRFSIASAATKAAMFSPSSRNTKTSIFPTPCAAWLNAPAFRSKRTTKPGRPETTAFEGPPPPNPRANHPTLAIRAGLRRRRPGGARLSGQAGRFGRKPSNFSASATRRMPGTTPSIGPRASISNCR